MTMTNPPTQPNAELRQMASFLWQTYVALTQEGFSEDQALKIIASIVTRPNNGSSGGAG
jgi:hypothetical protein